MIHPSFRWIGPSLIMGMASIAPAETTPPQPVTVGQQIAVALGSASPKTSDGMAYACYSMQPPAGMSIVATLAPANFAGQMVLGRGALCPVTSPLTVSDKAAAHNSDSAILFKSAGGRYILMVKGSVSTGRLALTIRDAGPSMASAPSSSRGATSAPADKAAARRELMKKQVGILEAEYARQAAEQRRAQLAAEREAERVRRELEREDREEQAAAARRAASTPSAHQMMMGAIATFNRTLNGPPPAPPPRPSARTSSRASSSAGLGRSGGSGSSGSGQSVARVGSGGSGSSMRLTETPIFSAGRPPEPPSLGPFPMAPRPVRQALASCSGCASEEGGSGSEAALRAEEAFQAAWRAADEADRREKERREEIQKQYSRDLAAWQQRESERRSACESGQTFRCKP